jgi:hypothetical protein
MAIEQGLIVDKLKNEGISETLASGLSFETEELLSSWVTAFKSALPTQVKGIETYTKEEIEAMSKDPQFKGAKGLQGYIDSLRQKTTATTTATSAVPDFAKLLNDAINPLLDEITALKVGKQKESFEVQVQNLATASGIIDADLIDEIKEGLKADATEADIKTRIEKKKATWARLGIKQFGTPGGGGNGGHGEIGNAMKAWKEKELKKIKK